MLKNKDRIHAYCALGLNPSDIAYHTNNSVNDVLIELKLTDRNFSDERALKRRMLNGSFQITVDGLEKKCPRCNEFYPLDSTFWPKNANASDQCSFICKACDNTRKSSTKKRVKREKEYHQKFKSCLNILNSIMRVSHH